MQYLLYPFILLIYFELFGRWLLYKFDRKPFEFSFVVGFAGVMAIMFITLWPITVFNQSFYLLFIACVGLFSMSIMLMIKDRKNIKISINYKWWLVFLALLIFQIYMSSTRTLGEVHGFDTLYYLNMIDLNIGNLELNSLHPHFGTYPNDDIRWFTYIFQSFYYFIPVVIYGFRSVLELVGMSFETLPAFVWGMQILSNAVFIATGLICVKKINPNNKWLNIAFIVLVVLFMNNLYYNNAFGFIGNNFRMSLHAVSTIILFDYFKEYKRKDLFLFILIQLGICGIASTGTFAIIFTLFGMFFVLYNKEKNLLKYYAIALYVPLTTIIVTKLQVQPWIFAAVGILCLSVYLLNDLILKLYANKYIRYGTIALTAIVLIASSILMSGNIIDLNYFFNNYSEIQDMSWDYFMFNDLRHWIFNLIVLIPLGYFLIKNYKHPFSIVCIVLIVTFFNPLASHFMNQINWVYYRAYDIIINQFTIMFFVYYLYNKINKKTMKNVVVIIMLISSVTLSYLQIPLYNHYLFIPSSDYNPIYKIENSELEVIRNIQRMIEDYDIEEPRIITSTFYMPTFIEDSTYLFGKEKRYNHTHYDEASYALYLILFPVDYIYDNFRPDEVPDYINMVKYLNECDYDILVVENGLYYDDPITKEHLPITTLIEEGGIYQKTEYSTAKYAVYYLKKD